MTLESTQLLKPSLGGLISAPTHFFMGLTVNLTEHTLNKQVTSPHRFHVHFNIHSQAALCTVVN